MLSITNLKDPLKPKRFEPLEILMQLAIKFILALSPVLVLIPRARYINLET